MGAQKGFTQKRLKIISFYAVMALAMVFALGTFVAGTTIVFAVGRSMLPKSAPSQPMLSQPESVPENKTDGLIPQDNQDTYQPDGAEGRQNQRGAGEVNLKQAQLRENLRQEKHEKNPDVQSFSGLLTDSRCGARHSRALGKSAAECARFCVRHGAQYIIVNGGNTYKLNGRATQIRNFAGQRVVVTGLLQDGAIRVRSLSAAD